MALATLRHWASKALGRPWPAMRFSNAQFERIRAEIRIEEERLPGYVAERYYPVRIGDLLSLRYQVVGKLGFGTTSTVWLARDLPGRRHVALKIFIRSSCMPENHLTREMNAYQRLDQGPKSHRGRSAVRNLIDSFTLSGPDGEHQCLVHPPLWDSMQTFISRNPIGRLPTPIVAIVLQQVFLALDYSRQCRIIHTDINPGNIMFGIEDYTIFDKFEQAELEAPTPRKEVDGRTIYLSRELVLPVAGRFGLPVLSDFGAAVCTEEKYPDTVQPDLYRSPEVIIQAPWSYEIDVWNVGCMIWDLFEGRHLFSGKDPEHGEYRSRAHLAEMIALLGPPPPEFVAKGSLKSKFFSEEGQFQAGIAAPPRVSLEELETSLEGSDKALFLQFVRKMLQWESHKRHTPEQLLEDQWLKGHTSR